MRIWVVALMGVGVTFVGGVGVIATIAEPPRAWTPGIVFITIAGMGGLLLIFSAMMAGWGALVGAHDDYVSLRHRAEGLRRDVDRLKAIVGSEAVRNSKGSSLFLGPQGLLWPGGVSTTIVKELRRMNPAPKRKKAAAKKTGRKSAQKK